MLQEEKKRKDILLDTTMRVVADVGLPAFAMKQVTQAAKTSDNLLSLWNKGKSASTVLSSCGRTDL